MAQTDFTISDVLAWARTKPADERYDYQSPRNCALCLFLKDTGRAELPAVDLYDIDCEGGWRDENTLRQPYPREMEPALSGTDWGDIFGDEQSWTFGGLAERLEALCPETPVTASDWARLDAYMADIELALS